MPLEAVMVCVDNSDYTRNGDYNPSRYMAESDAVQMVCSSKTAQNPENSVGILTTAGDRVEVLITPTTDLGKMIAEINKVKIGGGSDLLRGITTAQLALKHRQNKNQKQRIVAFVGSPVTATERELEVLGKNLKKNNVSLDLVSFGEIDENTAKLDKLMNAVNSGDTSHVVTIPVGPQLISDVLASSPILSDGDMPAAGGGGGGGAAGFEFGIDPQQDPELLLALRISMEEERARQQAADGGAPAEGAAAPAEGAPAEGAAAAPAADAAPTPAAAPAAPLPVASDATVNQAMADIDMEDMDEELRQALLLSLQESGPPAAAPAAEPAAPAGDAAPAAAAEPAPAEPAKDAEMKDAAAATETKAPAEASSATPAAAADATPDAAAIDNKWFQDPSFVNELLGSLPGVDMNDPRIQNALKEVGGDKKEGEGSSGSKDDKDKDADKK